MQTQMEATRSDAARVGLKKILVPTDFSPSANAAFKYALQLQENFRAQINVLHVLEPDGPPHFNRIAGALADLEKQPAKARKELRAWVDSTADADPTAKLLVRTGMPAYEIVEAAKELDVDLIVIATSGLTGWKHFCIGSTAESVVRAAPCSVLVVREKEHGFAC